MDLSTKKLLDGRLCVSRETELRLSLFETIFKQWAKRINLVAPSTAENSWQRHVEDSAQLLLIKPDMKSVTDLGSGGGFPGIILAILLDEDQESSVHLIESNRKKTAFLQTVKVSCAKRAIIHPSRIEDVLPSLQSTQYITGRALASLDKLFELTAVKLSKEAVGLFHKGRGYEKEIQESRANWNFDLIVHKSLINEESVILEVSNLQRI